jgi:hypothetical protein
MIEMKTFLKTKGFSSHPFNTFDADKEKNLSKFVVLPPYFESVFGLIDEPQPFLVLGMRGLGKTTLKRMISDRINDQYKDKVFPVDYSQFPFTKKKELSEVTLKDHLLELNRAIILQISKLINENPTFRNKLKPDTKEDLFHLFEIYLKPEEKEMIYPRLQSFFERLLHKYPKKKGRELFLTEKSIEDDVVQKGCFTFDKMQKLLKGFGFGSSYIFIDKLDETDRTMKEPENAGILLAPLICSLDIIQRDFFSFKFFVSAECIPNLKNRGFRNDKIQNQIITWTEEKLREVLKARIIAFNKEGKLLGKLGNICDDEIKDKVDEFVIKKSLNSPRNMLRFCNAIFSEHVEVAKSPEEPVSKKTVAVALKKYEYSLKVDRFVSEAD